MRDNKFRLMLKEGKPTVGTRIWSTWPIITEICASTDDIKAVEEEMIKISLKHGVQPRCELDTPEKAEYYKKLGVKHFCVFDETRDHQAIWNGPCKQVADIARR